MIPQQQQQQHPQQPMVPVNQRSPNAAGGMAPVVQQQQQQQSAAAPSSSSSPSRRTTGAVVPLYEMFLDLPHPCASPSCPGPFIIEAPPLPATATPPGTAAAASSNTTTIGSELHKNLLQIVRFAFPEYDESVDKADIPPPGQSAAAASSALNRYDVYAMQFTKGSTFQSFTFSLQLSNGIRVHGHVRRYLPPHFVARTRYDVGRRGERALCILTRATGADYLYASILKTVEAISAQQAALPATKMPHNSEPQKHFLYQLSRYQQHLATLYGTQPGMERGKPLIAAIPCLEIGNEYHSMYKDVDMSRFIIPTTLLQSSSVSASQQQQQQQSQHPLTYGGSILPLLRCVGVIHTIRIMTALLCERRVILISSSPTRLAACSNAAVSILTTGLLSWQYLYIPVLPPHLWQYLAAPYPYLIGLLSSAVPKLDHTDGLGEVMIIHLDTNQLETRGMDPSKIPQRLPDLFRSVVSGGGGVGLVPGQDFSQQMGASAGSGLALAGIAASSAPEQLAQDLYEVLKTDKKILYGITNANYAVNVVGETASKATIAVKNTFLKLRDKGRLYLTQRSNTGDSFGLGNGSADELGAEDASAVSDGPPIPENSLASDYIYTEGCHNEVSEEESRIAFTSFFLCLIGDMRWYLSAQPGGNAPILDRAKFLQQKRAMGEGEGTAIFPLLTSFCQTQMLEEFAKARIEDIKTQQVVSQDAPLFVQCTSYHRQHHVDFNILNVKRIVRQIAESNPSGSRLTGMLQTNARRTAMALTSNKGYEGTGDSAQIIAQLVDQCRESTSILFDVMSVIWLRLRDCKGMQWKHALQALLILKNLLYHGPLAAITEAVDGLDKIRLLQYYENIRPVSVLQVRLAASSVYNLLVDRAKLFQIRRSCIERRRQIQFPNTGLKREREPNIRIGVPFRSLHAMMHPNAARGTVVQLPPKPIVAQTMVRDPIRTPPPNQQQAPQQQQYKATPPPQQQQQQKAPPPPVAQEVDFFGGGTSSQHQQQVVVTPSSAVVNNDALNLFGTMTVSSGPTTTVPAPSQPRNPFDPFAVTSNVSSGVAHNPQQQRPNPTTLALPAPLQVSASAPPKFAQNPSNYPPQGGPAPSFHPPSGSAPSYHPTGGTVPTYPSSQQNAPHHPQSTQVAHQPSHPGQPPVFASVPGLAPIPHQPVMMMPPSTQQQQQQQWQPQHHTSPTAQQQQQAYGQPYPGGGYSMPQQPQQQMAPPGQAGYVVPTVAQFPPSQSQQRPSQPGLQFDPFAKK